MWSGDHPGGPELIGRPSARFESGLETLPEVQKWSEDPSEGSEVIGGPSERSGSGRETI